MGDLTAHFSVREWDQWAHLGQPAVPYPAQWVDSRLRVLATELEILREYCGGQPVRILSGYRTPALNAIVGGAAHSRHCEGDAADIVIASRTVGEVWDAVQHLVTLGTLTRVRGCGLYRTFVHLDTRPSDTLVTWVGQRTTV